MTKIGPWIEVEVADEGTDSDEFDLRGEFRDVQVYNPAIDNSTITLKPSRKSGETAVQAYTMDGNATGDFVNTNSARTGAGMNVFKDICAQFLTLVCGSTQSTAAVTFYVRGIDPIE